MKAIRIHNYGGPEVMKYEDAPVPVAGKGEAVVKIAAAGVNFIDIYFRSGLRKLRNCRSPPGTREPGRSASIGEGVTDVGRRSRRVRDGAGLVCGIRCCPGLEAREAAGQYRLQGSAPRSCFKA